MTIAEYLDAWKLCQRLVMRRVVGSVATIFGAMGVAGIVRLYNPLLADIVAPLIMFAVGVPLMLYGFSQADRAYRKFPGLVCPHCGGNLSRAKSVVIATGNCPHCGRRVLHDAMIGT